MLTGIPGGGSAATKSRSAYDTLQEFVHRQIETAADDEAAHRVESCAEILRCFLEGSLAEIFGELMPAR